MPEHISETEKVLLQNRNGGKKMKEYNKTSLKRKEQKMGEFNFMHGLTTL